MEGKSNSKSQYFIAKNGHYNHWCGDSMTPGVVNSRVSTDKRKALNWEGTDAPKILIPSALCLNSVGAPHSGGRRNCRLRGRANHSRVLKAGRGRGRGQRWLVYQSHLTKCPKVNHQEVKITSRCSLNKGFIK